MATTASNKQPMLVDHVLHTIVSLKDSIVSDIAFTGANTAIPIVNAIGTDGCIIEDIYAISTGTTALTINLYFSRSQDYLRPTEGVFIGQFDSAATAGGRSEFEGMPKILSPMPHTGDEAQFRALYIPKGLVLWAAVESGTAPSDAPILGVQGGWY
jgi:hypothetical protein